jgi:hypothetical protein
MFKKGDWKCPECGFENFASRDKCLKCACFRSKAFKQNSITKKKGDWDCSCGELNFASRTSCRKCGKQNTQQSMKKNDWNCQKCNEINFQFRNICHKCGVQKESMQTNNQVDVKKDTQDSVQKNINENCVVCMANPAEMCIKLCGHLSTCKDCSQQLAECPMCRTIYDPQNDLLRVYKS